MLLLVNALLLAVAGVLAVSGLIAAKTPDAKHLLDKLLPYQALIGVALLVLGVINLLHLLTAHLLVLLQMVPLFVVTALAVVASSILLGLLFGMPQIATWLPGEGATEKKGLALARKMAPFQTTIGVVGLVAVLLLLVQRLGVLT